MKRRYQATVTVNGETKTDSTTANSAEDASNKMALAAVTQNPGKDVIVGKPVLQDRIGKEAVQFLKSVFKFKQ